MAWTRDDWGNSQAVGGGDNSEGKIDVPFTVTARQSVTTSHPEKFFDTNSAPSREDVTDPNHPGSVPEPGAGFSGFPIYMEPEAMDHNGEPAHDLDGRPGQGHGGFVLGPGRPD